MKKRQASLVKGLRAIGYELFKAESLARRIIKNTQKESTYQAEFVKPFTKVWCNKCRRNVPDYHEHFKAGSEGDNELEISKENV